MQRCRHNARPEGNMMKDTESRVTIHMGASLDGLIARKDGSVDWLEISDEFPDGETVLLTLLREDQVATVLQLPATEKPPATSVENKNAAPVSGRLVESILT